MSLWPREFTHLCVDLLAAANHPAIAALHTCADAGLEIPLCGVVVTLNDGWRLVTQTLRGAPPGGDLQPASEDQRAPVAAEALPATTGAATEPAIKGRRLLDGLRRLVLAAYLPALQLAEVVVTAGYANNRPHLLVHCVDGARLYTTVVAAVQPGKALAGTPLHQVPNILV